MCCIITRFVILSLVALGMHATYASAQTAGFSGAASKSFSAPVDVDGEEILTTITKADVEALAYNNMPGNIVVSSAGALTSAAAVQENALSGSKTGLSASAVQGGSSLDIAEGSFTETNGIFESLALSTGPKNAAAYSSGGALAAASDEEDIGEESASVSDTEGGSFSFAGPFFGGADSSTFVRNTALTREGFEGFNVVGGADADATGAASGTGCYDIDGFACIEAFLSGK